MLISGVLQVLIWFLFVVGSLQKLLEHFFFNKKILNLLMFDYVLLTILINYNKNLLIISLIIHLSPSEREKLN